LKSFGPIGSALRCDTWNSPKPLHATLFDGFLAEYEHRR